MVIPAITAHKSTNITSFKGNHNTKQVVYQSGRTEAKQAPRSSRLLFKVLLGLCGLGTLGAGVSSCGKHEMQDIKPGKDTTVVVKPPVNPPTNARWAKLKKGVLSYMNHVSGDTITTNIKDSTALKETFNGDPMAIVQTLKVKTPESTTPDTFKFGTRILYDGNVIGKGEMAFYYDKDTLKSNNYSIDAKGKKSLSGISKYAEEGISLIEINKNNIKATEFTPAKLHEVDVTSFINKTTGKIIKIF